MFLHTYGPWEPAGYRHIRAFYYRKRAWTHAIEARIARTDTGLAWLTRVKQIGYSG